MAGLPPCTNDQFTSTKSVKFGDNCQSCGRNVYRSHLAEITNIAFQSIFWNICIVSETHSKMSMACYSRVFLTEHSVAVHFPLIAVELHQTEHPLS